MPGLTDFFPIFRSGRQTDSGGRTHEISTGDLDQIVRQYEAADDRAQCVITHDEMYSPFGYAAISEVRRNGDLLEARCDPATIEPKFAALVEAGRLENRSVQLIPSSDGGRLRLGHVAFLGAEPPAVEGLAPIRFAAGAALDFRSTTEQAWAEVGEAGRWADLYALLRRAFARIAPKEDIDEIIPAWQARDADRQVGAAEERARRAARKGGDEVTQAEFAAEKAEIEEQKQELATARAALETERAQFAVAGHRRRVDALIEAGKIVPAQAHGLAEFAARLDASAGGEIEFAAADGAATKGVASEILFGILERGETHALLGGPIAGGRRDAAETATAAGVRRAAYEYQADARERGEEVSFVDAVGAVSRGLQEVQ